MTNTIDNNVSTSSSTSTPDADKLKAIADQYLGLTKKRAQDKAENNNLIFRLIRKDEEPFMNYPTDNRTDRICVEIDKGEITKAVIQ